MYDAVQARLINWWEHGDQDRPCILLYCPRRAAEPADGCPSLDSYWLDPACHERRAVRGITGRRHFGEALPYHYVDFGAAALCGMQGCPMRWTGTETIWADPLYGSLEGALGAGIDRDLPFTVSVRAAFARVAERLDGRALVGPYCVGSPADNLAGLIGTDRFLFALYDEPELLKRALARQLELWLCEFGRVLSALRPGHTRPMTGWHGILAPGSTFPIQEDVGYMLGREHYDRFLLPGIAAMAESMEYPFFHLDGAGALKHLDALLGIGALKVIQWQPGDGRMAVAQWYDVIRRILRGGKSCQLYVEPEEVEPLVREVGAKGLLLIVNTSEERALRLADRYGLDENLIDGDIDDCQGTFSAHSGIGAGGPGAVRRLRLLAGDH